MKTIFAGAVSALALASSAFAADAPTFDLYRSSDAAQTLIAVAAVGETAPFAVASGADKSALDILADDAAATALAELKAKAETTQVADAEAIVEKEVKKSKKAKKGEATAEAHKVILVKEVAEEGQDAKVEKKIIKLDHVETPQADSAATAETPAAAAEIAATEPAEAAIAGEDDLAKFTKADGGKVFIVEKTENGAPTRLVKISGVSASSAGAFIDETAGLDDAEKAAIKTKLGL